MPNCVNPNQTYRGLHCLLYSMTTKIDLHAGQFFMLLLSSADFFFKINFSKDLFQERYMYQSVKLSEYKNSVCPDLGPNCLQKLSAQITKVAASEGRVKIPF